MSGWVLVCAVLVVGGCGGMPATSKPSGSVRASSATTSTAAGAVGVATAELAGFSWTQQPPAPIRPRTGFAAVWTGTEMVVWGGVDAPDGRGRLGDGAAFDAARGSWRVIASGPLAPQVAPQAVWTGHEVLLFGNGQAAYEPVADRWRAIPAAPDSTARVLAATWTGSEAVVFRDDRTAASYQPGSSTWTALPPVPPGSGSVVGIEPLLAGETLLVWVRWAESQQLADGVSSGSAGFELAALDLSTNTWQRRPHPGQPRGIVDPPLWTGDAAFIGAAQTWSGAGMGAPSANVPGLLYHPASDSYTEVALGPLDVMASGATWTGQSVIQTSFGVLGRAEGADVNPGDTAAWDAATDTWTRLPQAPATLQSNSRTFWTGTALLAYGPGGTLRLGA